ncbi:MAG: hypothetical protein WBY53_04135 [Acidobacteriaceae bacterium]
MAEDEELERAKEVVGQAKIKGLRPSECRAHMRRTLAREFQAIVDGFVEAAKKGSCPHVKLATELLKPVRSAPSRKKGTATYLVEKYERRVEERRRLREERLREEQMNAG